MNRKELVHRWRNALGTREMFYYPVKDNKSKGDFSPMILEIEVSVEEGKVKCEFSSYNNKYGLSIFNTDSNGIINKSTTFPIKYPFYNLRTVDNKKLSVQEFKNILKNTYSSEYNVYDHIELLYEEYDPFLKIDWGDGNIDDYSKQLNVSTQSVTINDITYKYDYIGSTGIKSHTYTESGRYIVKINANLPSLYGLQKMNTTSETPYCNIKKLIKWGNLHLRILSRMFLNADNYEYIQPLFELINNELYFVFSCNNMFSNIKYDIQNIVGDNLNSLPNIIDASQMFLNCSYKKIPPKFFQYNTKLQYINNIFEKNYSLVSVEEEVFSNLFFLIEANGCFYECSNLQTVSNLLFNNDINLKQNSWVFYNCFNLNAVGDGLFKNCFSLQFAEHSFYYCSRLKNVGQYLFENCYKLESVYNLFNGCISLETIGNDLFKNCYNIYNASGLFYNCMKVKVPDKLFYYLKCNETNYNLLGYHNDCKKYQRLLCEGMFYSNVVYVENLVYPEKNKVTIDSYATNCSDEDLKSEYYSYTFETFPYITLGKEMFSPQFILDLKKYDAVIDIGNFRDMARRELHKTESYYDYETDYGTSMSLAGSIYTTSVKGEAFPIWENPDVFYNKYDGVYGFTEEYLLYNEYSYSKNDIFHITSSWYHISYKPQFDNAGLIPLPKLYTNDIDDNNKTYFDYPYSIANNEFNYLCLCHQLIIENTEFKETKWSCEFEEVEYNT